MIRNTSKSGPAGRRHIPRAPLRRLGSAAPLLLALLLTAPAAAQTATSEAIDGVLELFTSQGCSSCPPADRVLSLYAGRREVVALSYHVDYWDYIGWKDPLGSRQNSDRQRAYGKAFGSTAVYTPQMIVNGRAEIVGSDGAQVEAALSDARLAHEARGASVRLERDGSTLRVFAEAPRSHPQGQEMVLVLVTYRDETVTQVSRGENEGHELVNSHSVRDWRVVGKTGGKPIEIDMPISTLADPDGGRMGYAAFLQTLDEKGAPGPIIAAAKLDLEP